MAVVLGAGSYRAVGPVSGSFVLCFVFLVYALDPTGPLAQAVVPQTLDFRIACVLNVKRSKFKTRCHETGDFFHNDELV